MLMTAGIGVMGMSGAAATPVNGSAIMNAANDVPLVEQVRAGGG